MNPAACPLEPPWDSASPQKGVSQDHDAHDHKIRALEAELAQCRADLKLTIGESAQDRTRAEKAEAERDDERAQKRAARTERNLAESECDALKARLAEFKDLISVRLNAEMDGWGPVLREEWIRQAREVQMRDDLARDKDDREG